jgi:hypothetical protein
MNIEYVGFPGLGFHEKNICVMFVFFIVSFLFFYRKYVCSKYCTRLKSTFGIRDLLALGGHICGQGFCSGL